VPFTLAHAAAALPFRRLRLVPSALVVGTLAPDFEYFLRLSPAGRFGHTLPGALLFSLPMALVVLWLFHTFVKLPTVKLLPESIQRRLVPHLHQFRFLGVGRSLWIVASVLVGIATHLIWDSFTHSTTWLYHHWSALRQPHRLPIAGQIPLYKILQHGSTSVGLAILLGPNHTGVHSSSRHTSFRLAEDRGHQCYDCGCALCGYAAGTRGTRNCDWASQVQQVRWRSGRHCDGSALVAAVGLWDLLVESLVGHGRRRKRRPHGTPAIIRLG
jgi:hypothetical protein